MCSYVPLPAARLQCLRRPYHKLVCSIQMGLPTYAFLCSVSACSIFLQCLHSPPGVAVRLAYLCRICVQHTCWAFSCSNCTAPYTTFMFAAYVLEVLLQHLHSPLKCNCLQHTCWPSSCSACTISCSASTSSLLTAAAAAG
jgi:hypothetical protein